MKDELTIGTTIRSEKSKPGTSKIPENKFMYVSGGLHPKTSTPVIYREIRSVEEAYQAIQPQVELVIKDERGIGNPELISFTKTDDFNFNEIMRRSSIMSKISIMQKLIERILEKAEENPDFLSLWNTQEGRKQMLEQLENIEQAIKPQLTISNPK